MSPAMLSPTAAKSRSPRRHDSRAPVVLDYSTAGASPTSKRRYKDVSSIPPRVLNSFFLWKRHHTELMARGEVPVLATSKEWSLAWWKLPQTEREYWQERFREENAAFLAANPGYSYGAVKGLKKKAREERQRQKRRERLFHHESGSIDTATSYEEDEIRFQQPLPTLSSLVATRSPPSILVDENGDSAERGNGEPSTAVETASSEVFKSHQTRCKSRSKAPGDADTSDVRYEPCLARNASLVNPIRASGPGLRATANGDQLWFTKSPVMLSPMSSLVGSQYVIKDVSIHEPCTSPLTSMFKEKFGDRF